MLTPFLIFFQESDEPAGGGGTAREREAPGPVDRTSGRAAFELSRQRTLEHSVPEDTLAEHSGDISRGIEERSIAHTPEMTPVYPERHIAGISGTAMAPEIPTVSKPAARARPRMRVASRYAGAAAGRVVRMARKARNLRHMDRHEMRAEAETYIAAHPYSLMGAAVAGFLLGRLLRR